MDCMSIAWLVGTLMVHRRVPMRGFRMLLPSSGMSVHRSAAGRHCFECSAQDGRTVRTASLVIGPTTAGSGVRGRLTHTSNADRPRSSLAAVSPTRSAS